MKKDDVSVSIGEESRLGESIAGGGTVVVAVVGSRHYPDLEEVQDFVRNLLPHVIVVSGGAKGVDQAAEKMAVARRLETISYRPVELDSGRFVIARHHYKGGIHYPVEYMQQLGEFYSFREAAFFRNEMIVAQATHVRVFRAPGKSNGTDNATKHAMRLGKSLKVTTPDPAHTR